MSVFQANIAGHIIRYAFRYDRTRLYFRKWLQPCEGEAEVMATPEEIAFAHSLIPTENAEDYAEFKALIGATGRALLRRDCCIFHSVALRYRDQAWLLAAPSGTGKTTQFMNWRKICPSEITMISGDMPVLELRGGELFVNPSPWNGKEDIGSRVSAPLGGVVFLEQGKENRIERLKAREAIEAAFPQLAYVPETEEEIRMTCRMLDRLLRRPVWKLTNKGDLASTQLLRGALSGGSHDAI